MKFRYPLSIIVSFLILATPAGAATFISTPPAQNSSGTGPFDFVASATGQNWLAYKLPTETGWHRCVPGSVKFTLTNLPDGDYPIAIADDVNLNSLAAQGQLYSGIAESCKTTDPPGSIPTVFWLNIYTPPPVQQPTPDLPVAPTQPVPTPPTDIALSPAEPSTHPTVCPRDRKALALAVRRRKAAQRAIKRHPTRTQRRQLLLASKAERRAKQLVAARRCMSKTTSVQRPKIEVQP